MRTRYEDERFWDLINRLACCAGFAVFATVSVELEFHIIPSATGIFDVLDHLFEIFGGAGIAGWVTWLGVNLGIFALDDWLKIRRRRP